MIHVLLPPDVRVRLIKALRQAGAREIGGILMGEHTNIDEFTVREITIHRSGTWTTFVRHVTEAIVGLRRFFERTQGAYTRYNYLGEWHSHPSFSTQPSATDDASMREIVQDPNVGATFAVLLIFRLHPSNELVGSSHTYLPDGTKHESQLTL
jgi:integrative and conjugative element protein (TIGR02256 family)